MINLHELDEWRVTDPRLPWAGDENHGAFQFPSPMGIAGRVLRCIVSSGYGWDHVSVSVAGSRNPPAWTEMEWIRRKFFKPDEAVMQYHAPAADYVDGHDGSGHPGCLHLWRPYDAREGVIPVPPKFMVGGMTPEEASAQADEYERRGLTVKHSW